MKFTVDSLVKPVPVIETDVPPAVDPDGGEEVVLMLLTVGAARVNWNTGPALLVPVGDVTVT